MACAGAPSPAEGLPYTHTRIRSGE
jgi:hypothetical protein